MISEDSLLWDYLSYDQKQLARDGGTLIKDCAHMRNEKLSDYSYLVFPFAKLYEGFLKQLFLDIGVITRRSYESNHFRIGKVLSPNMARTLGSRSAYSRIAHTYGESHATLLWTTWKQGRNLVFHYFPHNVCRLTFDEAKAQIERIVQVMDDMVRVTGVRHNR